MRSLFLITLLVIIVSPSSAFASDEMAQRHVKTVNYFLRAGDDLTQAQYEILARYDVLILPMEAAVYNADFFSYARRRNPNIILLAYVPSRSISIKDLDDGARIRKNLKSRIKDEWYIRSPQGIIVSAWPSTLPVSVATDWNEALPDFVSTVVMASGKWDGVFYDEVDDQISFLNEGNLDIDRDGVRDDPMIANNRWRTGMAHLLNRTRELLGARAIILINGSSHPDYQQAINGRMFESFPTPWEGSGKWRDSMASYFRLSQDGRTNPLFIISANTDNTGNSQNYSRMRYGLTSALLGNGYFGFDFGTQNHGQLWWYDEYDVALGKTSNTPYRIDAASSSSLTEGVWRRDYQYGTVLVNSTTNPSVINLDGEFEHLHGLQDRTINDGSYVSTITLDAHDGRLLLRPISHLTGTVYQNGAFARIFNARGEHKRNGFFAYSTAHRGSVMLYESQDGNLTVSAQGGRVMSTENGVSHEFVPFGNMHGGNINIAVAPISGATFIACAPEYTRDDIRDPSRITMSNVSGDVIASWFPFGSQYRGSVRIAMGDLNNDGYVELVAAAGPGYAPIVRIFSLHGKLLSGGFLAYDRSFQGGVSVALADLDGMGIRRIITAPGPGGSPHIRIFTEQARPLSPGFLAFQPSHRSGIRVLAVDIDGDGKDEIIPTSVRVFTYALK